MNWFIGQLVKEAGRRRFRSDDRVRYFTKNRKGDGVVLTPSFNKGVVVDFDSSGRRYKIKNDANEIVDVHPRNIIPDSVSRISNPTVLPSVSPEIAAPLSV